MIADALDRIRNTQRPILHHQLERAAEEKIANEHAGRIAPDDVGGPAATAKARAIDHVVMKQGRCVDELDGGRQTMMPRAPIIQQTGAGERQHRPHALSATGNQVPRQLRNQRHIALHSR
jgi:hypothetical protein